MRRSIERSEVLGKVRYGLVLVGLFVVMAMVFATRGQTVELTADEHTVALWHFNEGSGNIVYDESGNGNHGTIHGATWTTGMFGPALQFDGVNDYVEAPDDHSLRLEGGEGTVELWLKLLEEVPAWTYFLSKGNHRVDGYIMVCDPPTRCYADVYDLNAGTRRETQFGTIKVGKFYHLAFTFKVGEGIKTYTNGEFSNSNSLTSYNPSTGPLLLASYASRFFNGTIDEVRISNVARTAEEIAESASPNRRPIADAGSDRVIFVNEKALLDGTGSYDPEGAPLTYTWYEDLDKDGILEDEEIVGTEPTVTLTYTEADIGIHYYQLIVNDGEFNSMPDTVVTGVAGEGRPKPNMAFRLNHMSINWEEHPRLKTHGCLGFELELPEGYDYQSMDPDAETIVTIEIPTQDGKYAVGQDRITFREYRNYWLYQLLPVHLPKPPKPHGRR